MIQLVETGHHKVGVDEVRGLKEAMTSCLKPILVHLDNLQTWGELGAEIEETEYKSRDGFIPYSSNCGGVEIRTVIPKCGEYEFSFLDFGQCDECGEERCGEHGDCVYEGDGHLDAALRVWLKFEGVERGRLKFYLFCGGGNGDAPYFRTKYEHTVFEASFSCSSVFELKRAALPHLKNLLIAMGKKYE